MEQTIALVAALTTNQFLAFNLTTEGLSNETCRNYFSGPHVIRV